MDGKNLNQKRYTFQYNLLTQQLRKPRPQLKDDIPFGRIPTDHMLICDYLHDKGGWQNPQIMPFAPFSMSPSSVVFHYGQEIFEGLKAYRSQENSEQVFLFRPEQNAQRMYKSAQRLGMEPIPPELFLDCVREVVRVDMDWVLPSPGALYIRPTLIGLDEGVSYRTSMDYRFFIIMSPSKTYHAQGQSIAVYIERNEVRAFPGGVGEVKCGGNYAGALLALKRAKSKGAEQVLWLDGSHTYVEEVGAMNIMFVYKNKLVTPLLTGTILPGVTRDSILLLAKNTLGMDVEEKRISMNQVLDDARSGELLEAFGCGTGAIISPIDSFVDGEDRVSIKHGAGPVSTRIKDNLLAIQDGNALDPFGWRVSV